MPTHDDLVTDYLQAKQAMQDSGAGSPDDMTDEQQAGLWLHLYRHAALDMFNKLPRGIRRGYLRHWPRVRKLLEQALSSSPQAR